jgi:hypothetical protein
MLMSRLVPYRTKAPDAVKQRIEQTLATTMYLVQTTGPTSYVVQEQNCDKRHKVLIGSLQSCSCGDADVCIHVLFVLLKVGFRATSAVAISGLMKWLVDAHAQVLRVPATTPIVWQKSLIDSEVSSLPRASDDAVGFTGSLITFLLLIDRWTCCFVAGTASSLGHPQSRS